MFLKMVKTCSLLCLSVLILTHAQYLKSNNLLTVKNCNSELLSSSPVVINEFMAKNDTYITDQDGKYDDWIELYNNSSEAVDISGYYLSDKPDRPDKYELPEGTIIQGYGYLIVWADEDGEQEGLHANFKLSANGEELRMFTPDLVMIQEVIFGPQEPDMSYSRIPNGTGDFIINEPTFGEKNEGTSNLSDEENLFSDTWVSPNPADDVIHIRPQKNGSYKIRIFNSHGKVYFESILINEAIIDISSYEAGIYFVQSGNTIEKIIIK